MKRVAFAIVMFLGISARTFAVDMVGNDLINYFSSTCKTQGEYTRQAISDSQSLINILENIKNDQDCNTISGGISQLSNLESKLLQLESQNSLNIDIEKLTAQENELLVQLSQATDAFVQDDIKSTIRQIQIDKASNLSELSGNDKYRGENVKELYYKIVNTTDSLFTTIASNHRCLNNNPNILPAITSLTSAIGSSAMSIDPALSLGLSAATDFIGNTVDALRDRKYNKMIRKISDSSVALEGYKCVLESLSERWCSLEDAQDFLNLKASVRRQSNSESGLKSVIRLNDRDVPVLLDWLNKVRTGVPAATSADAERQEEVFQRDAKVRSADALGSGVIAENRPLFDSFATNEEKYSVLRSIIGSLTSNSCSSGGYSSSRAGSNPLTDVYSSSYAPFYLLGLSEIPREGSGFTVSFCDFDPFKQWPAGSGTFTPDLNEVQSRYDEWITKARDRVNQELTLILQPDALQVLTTAYEKTGNKWKYSAISSVSNLIDFLKNHRPQQFLTSSFKKIYEDTVLKLVKLKDIIEGGVIGDKYPDPKNALEEILKVAELEYGVIVFQSRLEMIVRVSIKEYLDSIDKSQNNTAAQLLAAESFLNVLAKISGTDNLALISADIKRARPIAIGNMNSFIEVFGKNINTILYNNNKKIKKSKDPLLNEIYTRNAAEICLMLSSMPTWPKSVKKKYCLNTQLEEVIPGGPSSSILTSHFLNQNFTKRNCGYRDYIRKSKIYQEWGIKL